MLYSFFIHFIKHYAWEPTAALVTKSYLCRLPALERFYRETKNFATKVDPHNLESQNQAKFIPVGLPRIPHLKCEADRSRGSRVMIGQTNKQTPKQRL